LRMRRAVLQRIEGRRHPFHGRTDRFSGLPPPPVLKSESIQNKRLKSGLRYARSGQVRVQQWVSRGGVCQVSAAALMGVGGWGTGWVFSRGWLERNLKLAV
jgi:hypothetical protein